ncbi:MAG: hypothetical protein ABSC94_25225 [Polyangiaceae bacterium]|jgi:hypothetical protein
MQENLQLPPWKVRGTVASVSPEDGAALALYREVQVRLRDGRVVDVPNAPKALAPIGATVVVDVSYYVPPSPWSHLMARSPWIVTRL